MNDLFENTEWGVVHPKEVKSIKIIAQKDKILSKEQRTFNRLTSRISNLQNEIVSEKEKCERLLTLYSEKMPHLEKQIAESQIKLAKIISGSTQSIKYGKRQLEDIECVILNLFDEAFTVIEPDEETELLYNQWAEVSYQEEKEEQMKEMRQMMEDLLRYEMGVDIDLSELEDSPESYASFQQKVREKMSEQKQQEDSRSANRKKSKKELEKELRKSQEEAIKLKSMRNIYISLVKVLHPDTETDPLEKMRKDELMKKVTVAYNEKDLTTLLKLEMEWVASEAHNLDLMTKDKLNIYIASLKEQVAELENEKKSICMHPRFQPIMHYARFTESLAMNKINSAISDCKMKMKVTEEVLSLVAQPNPKKNIIEFVNQSMKLFDQRSFMTDFDIFSPF
ncbi:MAG: hypothetical protein PHX49_00740 [Bacteroidales bacterium]|jgi:hypothetical protein|nr:hypothetical protein [Bacteroidales bacterium]